MSSAENTNASLVWLREKADADKFCAVLYTGGTVANFALGTTLEIAATTMRPGSIEQSTAFITGLAFYAGSVVTSFMATHHALSFARHEIRAAVGGAASPHSASQIPGSSPLEQ